MLDRRERLQKLWTTCAVLAGTEHGLGSSQIARLAPRGTRAGQAPVLDRLVRQGLVLAEPSNHGRVYRLNREHVLAAAVLGIARARVAILDRMGEVTGSLVPAPAHASVFGPFARGEAGADSDIDLLLVATAEGDLTAWEGQLRDVRSRVLAWTGNRCQVLAFDLARVRELAAGGEPIVAEWRNDAVHLGGGRLIDILDGHQRGRSEPRPRVVGGDPASPSTSR